jgi:lysophospholipase L1-like esterase
MSQTNANVPGGDSVVLVNAASANETVYLPRGFAVGRRFTVRRVESSGFTVTIVPPSGESLDGVTDATATVSGNSEKTFMLRDPQLWISFGGGGGGSVTGTGGGAVTSTAQIAADAAFTGAYVKSNYLFNFNPDTTRFARAAVGRVRAGTGVMKSLHIGDSTTRGFGAEGAYASTFPKTLDYPTQFAKLLNSYYIPAVSSFGVGSGYITLGSVANDDRWTVGSGWAVDAYGFGGEPSAAGLKSGSAYLSTSSASGALAYAPGTSCDRMDIYYYRSTGNGTMTASIDGGTAVVTDTGSGAAGVQKVTITASTIASNHVLSITRSSGAGILVLGVEAYLSATPQVRVANVGLGSTRTAEWAYSAAGLGFYSADCIKAYAPDVSWIMLGINDSRYAVSSSAWTANMSTIIDACKVSGDVVLMTVIPSLNGSSGTDTSLEAAYRTACQSLAVTKSCALVDVYGRFGSYTLGNAAGYYYDGVHLNAPGYSDIAGACFEAFRSF